MGGGFKTVTVRGFEAAVQKPDASIEEGHISVMMKVWDAGFHSG